MLEEMGIEYTTTLAQFNGEQKSPDYLQLNPNGRSPTLVDQPKDGSEPIIAFESSSTNPYTRSKKRASLL